jgi:endonuclease III
MKNALKHADELKSLFKKLLRDGKPEPMQPMEPLKALVRGAMSYDVSDERADSAMRAIDKEFVDLNELRVATDLEIQELLGTRYPDIEKRVFMITQSLNAIFEKEHTLNLERLKTISKRDSRQFLRDLPEVSPFVEAFVMLFAFEGHCVPVDNQMADYLKNEEIVDENMSNEDIQKFVEHHVKAEDCFDFYTVLRRAAAASETKKKARAK